MRRSQTLALISFISFFFSSRRRHTRLQGDWSSDVCSSDLRLAIGALKRLVTGGQVHDGQTAGAQERALVPYDALPVGTAVGQRGGHGGDAEIGRASCRERG